MNGAPWGGSEELWSRTALRLAELGHEVRASVLKWPSRPDRLAQLAAGGVELTYRPREKGMVRRFLARSMSPLFPGPLDYNEILWLKKRAPHMVVISQGGPWDGVPWMLACCRTHLAYCPVVQAHSEIWWPLDEELESFQTAYKNARMPVFVSRSNLRLLERQCGIDLDRAEVMFNPLNLGSRGEVPWPVDQEVAHLACVGRLEPRAKGQDLLFQVLAQPKWRARPVRLNLYGTGSGERSLRSLAANLELDSVRFHGQVSHVRDIWAANHALILASRFEGLPLAIVEAMLCGRPVITTDVAGNTEIVEDEINGFVAAGPSVRLLDEALERAWLRRQDWVAMGMRARRHALKAAPEDPIGEFARKLLNVAGPSLVEKGEPE